MTKDNVNSEGKSGLALQGKGKLYSSGRLESSVCDDENKKNKQVLLYFVHVRREGSGGTYQEEEGWTCVVADGGLANDVCRSGQVNNGEEGERKRKERVVVLGEGATAGLSWR